MLSGDASEGLHADSSLLSEKDAYGEMNTISRMNSRDTWKTRAAGPVIMQNSHMTHISLDQLKKLRAETSAGVSDCRQALEDAGGDYSKAKKLCLERAVEKAAKKADRKTASGCIHSYIHANGRVGVLVELCCETDFVARTPDFKTLAHELALQIAAMNPQNVKALLAGEYIRDPKITVEHLIKQTIAKVGENITVSRFTRLALGDN